MRRRFKRGNDLKLRLLLQRASQLKKARRSYKARIRSRRLYKLDLYQTHQTHCSAAYGRPHAVVTVILLGIDDYSVQVVVVIRFIMKCMFLLFKKP
jgi:hypothetical protein